MTKKFCVNSVINNSSFKDAFDLIKKSHYILIVTHVNPDADTICSALALSNYFHENKINHKVFNVGTNLPMSLDFISRFDKITNKFPNSYDLIISVDCGGVKRLGFKFPQNIPFINIDHHHSNENFGTVNLLDVNSASTAEVIYDFFEANDLNISKNSAEAIYMGIYDDSLCLTSTRCDEFTFEKIQKLIKLGVSPSYVAYMYKRRDSLAKYRIMPKILESLELHDEGNIATIYVKNEWFDTTGASVLDTEVVLDMVLNIAVVNIAMFIRVIDGKARISLRSKDDTDVSSIASIYGGGGHPNAAGCTICESDLFKVRDILLKEILEKKE